MLSFSALRPGMSVPMHGKVGVDLIDDLAQEVVPQEWPDLSWFAAEG